MKTNKRAILIIISLLLVTLIISSCGSKSAMTEDSMQGNVDMESSGSPGANPEEEGLNAGIGDGSLEPEKVITTVQLYLETTEFDSTVKNLNDIINKNKGYIESSHISDRGRINNKIFKYANYVMRIPKNNVEGFTDAIDSIGNITSQNISKEDITKQYYDTESRLNLLKTKEERMTALLEKADRMEDIITIENQLSEIIHQKENMTKSILDMDDRVAYSIVHLNISEVEKLKSSVTAETSFGKRISNAFNDSLYAFKVFLEGLVLFFIYVFPFLLVGSLLAFLIFKLISAIKKNRK